MAMKILVACSIMHIALAVTPVQKAVQMLEGMLEKAKSAKHEENVQFAGFKQFCGDVTIQKQDAIKEADGQIELLKADVEKANSEAERLGDEVVGHEKEITGWEKDGKDATKVREKERATYLEAHADYTESIQALSRAITILKQQNFDRAAKSFLQKVSAFQRTPEHARKVIEAFLDRTAEDREDAPDVDNNLGYKETAYKFQSGEIITMLEKLKDQFKDELTKLEKGEVEKRHTYNMLSQDLESQTTDAKNAIQDKTVNQAKNKQLSIEKSADLSEVTGVRNADDKYLSDLTALCDKKTTEFDSRTKLRDDEIEALGKAIDLLSGDEVSNAKQHLPSLRQVQSSAFAQLRANTLSPDQARAAAFLREESTRLDSHLLSTIAMDARADPFKKVKQLLEELLARLKQEATNEAEHKGWCDKELSTNKHTRESKTAEVDTLTSTIDGLDSDIKLLEKDIVKKSKGVAEIEGAVAKFTDKRKEEKATNEATIKDAQEGQKAIASAIKILQEFYAKAAKGKSLIVSKVIEGKQQPPVPEIFEDEYKGQQSAKGGVVGMLQVIQSDFERLEADTKSSETAAQSQYDEFMGDSAQTKASLETDIKHAKSSKLGKEGELTQAKDNLQTAQKTLDSALEYYDKLKEPCLGGGETFEERSSRRKEEIEALKEALRILSGDDISALQEVVE
jgi:hypothetical protein